MHSAARDELQSFKLPKRNRQLESGGSKEAKTVADSFYPTLSISIHDLTHMTLLWQTINNKFKIDQFSFYKEI